MTDIYRSDQLLFPTTGIALGSGLRPYIIFNMVSTVDGKATIKASSKTDRRTMGWLRSRVDGVLWGGGTLRSDGIAFRIPADLMPQNPPFGITWSQSGNLPLVHPLWQGDRLRRLIFVGAKLNPKKHQQLAQLGQLNSVSCLSEMLILLWDKFQIKTLLVEGGPTLNQLLIDQGFGDELFLTIAPCLYGGKSEPIITAESILPTSVNLQLRSVQDYENEIYVRYSLLRA